MLWFRYLLLLLVCACGFRPIYQNQAIPRELKLIKLEEIGEREGVILQNQLEDLLGSSDNNYKYKLYIDLKKEKMPAVINRLSDIVTNDIIITASYKLIRIEDEKLLLEDKISGKTSSISTINQFSSYISERAGYEDITESIALELKNALALYFLENDR